MLRRLLCILLTLCLLIGYAAAEDSASAAPTQEPPEGALANGMVDGAGESAVQGLQQRLIDLGLLTGEADGHFGAATEVAVELFQQMYGLDATGYADEETLSALSAAQDGVLEVQEDLKMCIRDRDTRAHTARMLRRRGARQGKRTWHAGRGAGLRHRAWAAASGRGGGAICRPLCPVAAPRAAVQSGRRRDVSAIPLFSQARQALWPAGVRGGKRMWLRLDLDGVEMYLRIQGFRKSALPDDDAWCRVSLHLQSPWLHYDLDEHILCSEEVKWLSKTIEDAFDKRLPKNEELEFIEPNIRFIFSCLDAEGELTRPPMADLQVFFWNGYPTANYLSLCFGEADLDALRQYLRLVTGEADSSDPRVLFWLDKRCV